MSISLLRFSLCLWALCASSAFAQTYGQKMVAAVVVAEAGGEGRVGITAVVEVIRTRADAHGVSMLTEVQRPRAYSALNGTNMEALYRKHSQENVYAQALAIVRTAYNAPETLPGAARGANHFCRTNARPAWAVDLKPVVTIGHHAFFKL